MFFIMCVLQYSSLNLRSKVLNVRSKPLNVHSKFLNDYSVVRNGDFIVGATSSLHVFEMVEKRPCCTSYDYHGRPNQLSLARSGKLNPNERIALGVL